LWAINLNEFKQLFGLSKSVVEQFINEREFIGSNQDQPKYMSTKDEIVLVLLYLCQHSVDIFLAAVFKSQKIIYNTKHCLIVWFYQLLKNKLSIL
jgi:hypothetical protein